MKLVKSLLLGSAAGFAAVAGAQAADLPSRKAAPVEYVRVCSTYGAGFFYIPGTQTCLRVGGRIRAEYLVQETFDGVGLDTSDGYGFRARGRLNIDARTATAYGTLRTFIRFEMTVSNGSYGQGVNSTGPQFVAVRGGAGGTVSNLDKGFVQFGPVTAGRAQSFFDFYADTHNYGPIRGSDMTSNLLAYTATFGSGFSATISLEDRSERQVVGNFVTGGQTYPDIVGSLNLTQGWGSAQLSGAVFERNGQLGQGFVGGASDKTGYAIQGGVKINLPMLAAGDELWLQAAYTEGGISYLGYGGAGAGSTWGPNSNVGRLAFVNSDANVDVNGRTILTKGYALTAVLLHYWTPTIRQAVYGSYSELDYGRGVFVGGVANQDPKEFRIGSNLVWSPVSGLDIGVEVLYAKAEVKTRIQAAGRPLGVLIKSDDALSARLRIQRDF
ncbi:hypothetical protein ASG72_12605 [Bosea sp. Leaf344]|uniref:porin n=1 Tax=Bosea sp. Leaf344 TaxID=1736346 RepID=UPI0006FA8BED|nr:porin [Bosea sp. Leaf344]KQU50700.1 hypothetical protein ASG72_12605 [Bosea sp. Leaf344]